MTRHQKSERVLRAWSKVIEVNKKHCLLLDWFNIKLEMFIATSSDHMPEPSIIFITMKCLWENGNRR